MSIRAWDWACDQQVGSPIAKSVLVALAKFADERGVCFPGQRSLMQITELSPASVSRALRDLEAGAFLARERRHGQGGYRTSDRYRLNLGDLPITQPCRQTASKAERLQGSLTPPTHHTATPTHHSDRAGTVREPSVEPSDKPARDAFAEFWPIYPRKVGKHAAAKAFTGAAKRAPVEVILAGVRRYADDPNLPPEQFIPHPATWLQADRWDDPAEPARAGRGRPSREQDAASIMAAAAALFPIAHPAPLALPGGSA